MIRNRTAFLVAGAFAGLMTLSACGGGGYDNTAAPAYQLPSANQQDVNEPGTNQEVIPVGGVRLAVAQVANLGQVVTDQNGLTLYRFDKDKAKPSASNCNNACAKMWPPVLGEPASVQLQGVDKSLVGAVTRADGSKQLTLNGWPLYTFGKDTAPGEAKGQGVGTTWFAVSPQGKKAQAVSNSTPGSSSAPGNGYSSGSGGY